MFDVDYNQLSIVVFMTNVIAKLIALPKSVGRFIYGLHIMTAYIDLQH